MWEERVTWDEPVPEFVHHMWLQWRSESPLLMGKLIPRCYYPKDVHVAFKQLQQAYSGVVYLRMVDTTGIVHTSLVMAKTIKRISIPRLELCGAQLLAHLLHHCQKVLEFPTEDVFAWMDSTIVLNWIVGNPRRLKTYVGNRVSYIVDLVPPNRWYHVEGSQNPADCASRGLLPSELLTHDLWWNGPSWLKLGIQSWPIPDSLPPNEPSVEAEEMCSHLAIVSDPVIPIDRFSSFTRLTRVTAWMKRFLYNCRASKRGLSRKVEPLSVEELNQAMMYWIRVIQKDHFSDEYKALCKKVQLPTSSVLLSLRPFLDDMGLLRVGGRQQNSKLIYDSQHPLILHGNHPISKLIIRSEHLRLLHAGPLLVAASLNRRFHIIGGRRVIRSIARSCVTCRRKSLRPEPPMMGQLPSERVTPDTVFDRVGVDYAGPILIKRGYTRMPVVLKTYICVFVSLTVKAVHLELVSDLTAEAFIACLRRFIACRSKRYGATMDRTSWVPHDRSRSYLIFCREILPMKTSPTFARITASFGISSQREHLTLEDFGRPLLRASRSIYTVLWATST